MIVAGKQNIWKSIPVEIPDNRLLNGSDLG